MPLFCLKKKYVEFHLRVKIKDVPMAPISSTFLPAPSAATSQLSFWTQRLPFFPFLLFTPFSIFSIIPKIWLQELCSCCSLYLLTENLPQFCSVNFMSVKSTLIIYSSTSNIYILFIYLFIICFLPLENVNLKEQNFASFIQFSILRT